MPLGRADFSLIPPEILWAYNAGDADATIRLYHILKPKIKEVGSYFYYRDTLMPLRANLTVSELKGMRMSVKKIDVMHEMLTLNLDRLEKRMKKLSGNPELNPRSVNQLKVVLYENMKLPVLFETASGQPATSFDVLETLNKKHPNEFLSSLIEYRKLFKVRSTYLEGFEAFLDKEDRVHTSFVVGGAVSGRVTSREPPLATVPRDREYKIGKENNVLSLRELFETDKDHVLLYADYSQIELRVAAVLSGEKEMLDAFTKGEDVHDRTARGIFSEKYISKEMIAEALAKGDTNTASHYEARRKEQRNDAKRVNFGLLYGAADKSLADQFNVPREVARGIFDKFYSYYKFLASFIKGIPVLARQEGLLVSPFGKRRVFYYPSDDRDWKAIGELNRQAVNFLPQSCAAEVLFRSMNRICDRFRKENLDAWPINLVYDSVTIELHRKHLKRVQKIVDEEMLRPVPELNNYVFPYEVGTGSSWAAAEHSAKKRG